MAEFAHIDDALVIIFAPGPVSKDEWARLMNELKKKPITRVISGALGAFEANSIQRQEGSAYVKEHHIKMVSITDDRLVRGFVTAASWVGADIRAFAWKDLDAAIKHAGFVGEEKVAQVANLVLQLRRATERQSSPVKRAG